MSLSSLVDETIAKREPQFLRARMRPAVLEHAQFISAKYNLDPAKMQTLSNDLTPLAVMPPTEPTKASNAIDALARYIPTEVVTLYVAAVAAMPAIKQALGVGELGVYWSFVVLTPVLFILIMAGKRRSGGLSAFPDARSWPYWRMSASAIAFLVWALAVPGSPYLTSDGGKIVAGFAALLISTFLTLLDPIIERPAPRNDSPG